MTGGGSGSADARAAAEMQSKLMKQYAATGLPALKGALGYTRGALAQEGLPGYVESAYRQAQTGVLDQNVQDLSGLRRSIVSRGDPSQMGGSFLSGITGASASAGDALTREVAGIRTSRAVAGVEQRNKLLNILAGGAATGTNLAAGFGQLGNQARSLNYQPNQTGGIVAGGLSAGLGLYASLNNKPLTSNLGYTQNPFDTSLWPGMP